MTGLFILLSLLSISWTAFRAGESWRAAQTIKAFSDDNIDMLAVAYGDERAQEIVRATAQRILLLIDEEG